MPLLLLLLLVLLAAAVGAVCQARTHEVRERMPSRD